MTQLNYDNIKKILNAYGQQGVNQLITIVGVKTGKLKASIDYTTNSKKGTLKFTWLKYGDYINPCVKKTGWKTTPGYKKVLNKNFYASLANDLSKQIAKDLTTELVKDLKNLNK